MAPYITAYVILGDCYTSRPHEDTQACTVQGHGDYKCRDVQLVKSSQLAISQLVILNPATFASQD